MFEWKSITETIERCFIVIIPRDILPSIKALAEESISFSTLNYPQTQIILSMLTFGSLKSSVGCGKRGDERKVLNVILFQACWAMLEEDWNWKERMKEKPHNPNYYLIINEFKAGLGRELFSRLLSDAAVLTLSWHLMFTFLRWWKWRRKK